MTPYEQIQGDIKATEEKAAELKALLAEIAAVERPAAIAKVLTLIAEHGLTRKECESPTWRKRAYKARKPKTNTTA